MKKNDVETEIKIESNITEDITECIVEEPKEKPITEEKIIDTDTVVEEEELPAEVDAPDAPTETEAEGKQL